MGLFDKIKSAFLGEKKEEKQPQATETTEESSAAVEEAPASEAPESSQALETEPIETEAPAEEEIPPVEETRITTKDDEPEEPALVEENLTADQKETKTFERGLSKSRKSFTRRLNELLANFRYEDEEFFEELEDLLIESDVGFEATMQISEIMREEARVQNIRTITQAGQVLVETMVDMYGETNPEYVEFNENPNGLTVILFVGVNGVGKTTSIAKLAHQYQEKGKKVVLAAGDTFRAGAIEQLKVWGGRVGAEVVATKQGGDPAAVVYDGIETARRMGADVLMVDTAGRLQNKKNLMDELAKMKRVISREIPDAPHETLLVLDATTGQNALSQAKIFKETTDVTGIVLTKMDGTARGGIVLAIGKELGIPVKFVGLGESMNDLHEFDTEKFAYGLFKDLIEQTA